MFWTKELPTEAGYYFRKNEDGNIYVVEVEKITGPIHSYCYVEGQRVVTGSQWAGPIPFPGEPGKFMIEEVRTEHMTGIITIKCRNYAAFYEFIHRLMLQGA